MNREIKFRAWDKVLKYMIQTGYDNWISFGGECYTGSDRKYNTPNIEITKVKDLILMQYTGLKDGSGKEIYEGDIVSVKSIIYDTIEPFEKSTKIEFQIFCEVIWCNKIAGYDLKKIDGDNKPGAWGFYNENVNPFEVIGNIYENPELINSK